MRTDDELLRHAADRALKREEYLGWVLTAYQKAEDWSEAKVRKYLGVTEANWSRLALCLRPRPETFLKDVTQIAETFGIDRGVLAALIRRVDAVEVIQKRSELGRAGTMLAARTRKEKNRSDKPEGNGDE